MITRRSLITSVTALLAAPAIVSAESIMPVRSFRPTTVGIPVGMEAFDAYIGSLDLDSPSMADDQSLLRFIIATARREFTSSADLLPVPEHL